LAERAKDNTDRFPDLDLVALVAFTTTPSVDDISVAVVTLLVLGVVDAALASRWRPISSSSSSIAK